MDNQSAIQRAQLYGFLADAFLYPHDNWTEDVVTVHQIAQAIQLTDVELEIAPLDLHELQSAHRQTFGLAGSLCYETEYGLPHEFRQSQEMADIAGFYRAFGLKVGGEARERPDHIAVELEFLHFMALKEAHARQTADPEHVQICQDAQRKFLQDHLGSWIELFAQSVAHNAPGSPFACLARFASYFVQSDADRLGVRLNPRDLADVRHTPFDSDFSCAACELPGQMQGLIRADTIR